MGKSWASTDGSFVPAVLAATGVGTWDYDVAKGICYCDSMMSTFYGLSAREGDWGIPIERMTEIIHPADRARGAERRAHKIKMGGVFVNEYRVAPPGGPVRWLLARGCYEADDTGRVVRGRGIAIDVTDSKRDGYADYQAFFTVNDPGGEHETALDRAASHALAARKAIDEMGDPGLQKARPIVDQLLLEIGRLLAAAVEQDRVH